MAFVSSGSLISANMNPVGVNPLRIGAIVFVHILLAFLVIHYVPKLFKKKISRVGLLHERDNHGWQSFSPEDQG